MKRVLIVDDESIVRVALRSLTDWESWGYTLVKDCLDGFQALEYIRNHPVELLITDMKMPGLDGLGLIRRLKEMLDEEYPLPELRQSVTYQRQWESLQQEAFRQLQQIKLLVQQR